MCEGRSVRDEVGEVYTGRSCVAVKTMVRNLDLAVGVMEGCGKIVSKQMACQIYVFMGFTRNCIICVSFVCLNIFYIFNSLHPLLHCVKCCFEVE